MRETSSARDRILLAAVEAASIHGIAKVSVGDVATRAGLSRQTLYKHFASRDELIAEVVVHETALLVARVVEATRSCDNPRDALEVGILTALRLSREHPLLDRLIRTEPEALLPLITSDGGPVIAQVRAVVEAIVVDRLPTLSTVQVRRLADVVTRLLISYAVSAPDDPPEVVAASVAAFLTEGAISGALPR